MKIALITNKFFIGGGIEHIYQICIAMPTIKFAVFGNKGDAEYKFEKLDNVTIYNNGYRKNDIDSFDPDIVHFHSLTPLLKLYNLKYKKIVTIHGMHIHKYEYLSGIKSKILYIIRLYLEKYLYKKVDKIITVSDDDKQYLYEKYNLQSILIHNGIDTKNIEKITNKKVTLKKELKFPTNKKICITVARFDFPKDYDTLVDAIQIVNQKSDEYIFYFIGDGDIKQQIENKVKKLNINNIIFLGTRQDISKIMKASDIFILPSKWEGLPITALEALASKLKLLLSNTYGNRTVYKYNKENVELFELFDKTDLSNKILNSSFNFSEIKNFFTLEKMVKKLEQVYYDII